MMPVIKSLIPAGIYMPAKEYFGSTRICIWKSRSTLDQNGYVITGSGESNGALTRKDDIYTVTVEWNGQKETFTLRAAP